MPLEHLPLEPTYLPYLTSTHIVPLQVIQGLLPLIRSSPARGRDALSNGTGRQSIIVCLPVTDTRVGLPFAGAQAMSASATLQGLQVLRREIKIASLSMANPEAMKNIRVVTVEVGTVDTDGHHQHHRRGQSGSIDIRTSIEDWSASEKSVYGQSFLTLNVGNVQVGKSRKPTPVSHFVRTIVNIINGQSYGNGSSVPLLAGAFYKLRNWLRGDRISVGAGGELLIRCDLHSGPRSLIRFSSLAGTYALASKLPSFVLDGLINLPHLLVSVRNGLLPVTPTRIIPADQLPPPVTQPKAIAKAHEGPISPSQKHAKVSSVATVITRTRDEESSSSDETRSNPWSNDDADVESNAGDTSVVESSWVNLHEKHD